MQAKNTDTVHIFVFLGAAMIYSLVMVEDLAGEIKIRRRKRVGSQDDLAQALKVSKPTVQNIESGRTLTMNPRQAIAIARLLFDEDERDEVIEKLTTKKGGARGASSPLPTDKADVSDGSLQDDTRHSQAPASAASGKQKPKVKHGRN